VRIIDNANPNVAPPSVRKGTTVPKTIKMPATPDQAEARFGELADLATATNWEAAAIIWLMTGEGTRGGKRDFTFETPASFARKGYRGFKSDQTVRHYRAVLQAKIDADECAAPAYGKPWSPPNMEWPSPSPKSVQDMALHAAKAVKEATPEQIAEVIQMRPEVAKAVAASPAFKEKLAEERAKGAAQERKEREARMEREREITAELAEERAVADAEMPRSEMETLLAAEAELVKATEALKRADAALAAREWSADEFESLAQGFDRVEAALASAKKTLGIAEIDSALLGEKMEG
jgi:hypothetical protein